MTTQKQVLRIGNAGGYWGDDNTALQRQISGGRLDYVSIDFLAEITMSIMQKQKSRDPEAGYAKDFVTTLEPVLKKILADGTRIITNAGGVNPRACARAIAAMAKRQGLNPKIAVVCGDDILDSIDAMRKDGIKFDNMETGESFSDISSSVLAANVYFGAAPVVEALKSNPDIVITGRVTDTGITLAPMIFEFGWESNDWNKLAAGIVAGHMIECGSQACGGNFSDWRLVKDYRNIGFPIVEMSRDGEFVVTKHSGTGGLVSVDTVREQVFYEMGDPKAYITPDVVADFSTIKLKADGDQRVKVTGIKGYEPTHLYKVSMAYADGYKNVSSILVSGPDAETKAEIFDQLFRERCKPLKLDKIESEYFGWNACHRSLGGAFPANEILVRWGTRSKEQDKLKAFSKIAPSLILAGPAGVAVTGGVAKPQEVVSYWPALIPKNSVSATIVVFENGEEAKSFEYAMTVTGNFRGILDKENTSRCDKATRNVKESIGSPWIKSSPKEECEIIALEKICLGRSGDKGDMCNVGVMARSQEAFEFLDRYLTAEQVKNWFQELCFGPVTRFRVPGLLGFNFLLESALGGGGTMTLRSDAQGKTFAQALLRQKVTVPKSVIESVVLR